MCSFGLVEPNMTMNEVQLNYGVFFFSVRFHLADKARLCTNKVGNVNDYYLTQT